MGLAVSLSGCETLFGERHTEVKCPRADVASQVGSIILPVDTGDSVGYHAKLTDLTGTCDIGDDSASVTLKVTINVGAEGGGAPDKKFDLPYFVAVLDPNDHIVAKEELTNAVELTEGKSSSTDTLEETIPLAEPETASRYHIIVGFQLTQEQLAYNRRILFNH